MKYFIVTCHGWSASNWIAYSLNLNSHILCTHSARNEAAKDKDLQSNENLQKNLQALHHGYANRQSRGLDAIYDEIESKGTAPVYGSVHVLRMRDIPIILSKFGEPERKFSLVNVIRHPVNLVWSGYGQFKDLFRYDLNELYWTTGKALSQAKDFIIEIGAKYNIKVGDLDNLAFIGACAILQSLKEDVQAYPAVIKSANIEFKGTYHMEKLTTSKDYYSSLCENLNLKDFMDTKYIEAVFKTGVVNKHKSDNKILTPVDRYNSFNEWQKEVYNHFLILNNLVEPYCQFGYPMATT